MTNCQIYDMVTIIISNMKKLEQLKEENREPIELKCSWCKATLSCKQCGADLFKDKSYTQGVRDAMEKLRGLHFHGCDLMENEVGTGKCDCGIDEILQALIK